MQTLRKAIVLITLLSVTGTFSFGQKQKDDSLTSVVKAMANSNIYEVSYTVGYAGSVSKQYLRFEQLLTLATGQQLLALATNNKNAVVRLYALQALKRKKINIPDALIQQFQNDHTIVDMLKGCIANKKGVNILAQQDLKSSYGLSN